MTYISNSAALLAFFVFLASTCVMAQTEDMTGAENSTTQAGAINKPADTTKKAAVKKRQVKKKKSMGGTPGSEYKFSAQDTTPAYRFDKEGNPILKHTSVGKSASQKSKRAGAKGSGTPANNSLPKLRATPAIGKNSHKYVCPMGEFEDDKPGKCPKCGMTLVEKQ